MMEGFAGNRLATWTTNKGFCEVGREPFSYCGDRILDTPLGSDRRRVGVWDVRIGEAFCAARSLRGESPLVRGSESHKLRCKALHGDGSRASFAPRNGRGRVHF